MCIKLQGVYPAFDFFTIITDDVHKVHTQISAILYKPFYVCYIVLVAIPLDKNK